MKTQPIKELFENATQRPWKTEAGHVYSPYGNIASASDPHASTIVGHCPLDCGSKYLKEGFSNAQLITHSVNNIERAIEALKIAQVWLANSVPLAHMKEPHPLPIIAKALEELEVVQLP